MNHEARDPGHADKPHHMQSLADIGRVAAQLQRESAEALRQIGQDLAFLLDRAQADLRQVLAHAQEGALTGVPPNLACWQPAEALEYLERHLDHLARVNPGNTHVAALLRRRPELFARAAVWLEVARRHYERDHPGSEDPADQRVDNRIGPA